MIHDHDYARVRRCDLLELRKDQQVREPPPMHPTKRTIGILGAVALLWVGIIALVVWVW